MTGRPLPALRRARMVNGLTLRQAAQYADMSFSTLAKIERGEVTLTARQAVDLALIYATDIRVLLADLHNDPKTQAMLSRLAELSKVDTARKSREN